MASTQQTLSALSERYAQAKAGYPTEGRRRWRLRTAESVWALDVDARSDVLGAEGFDQLVPLSDPDPRDAVAGPEVSALGLLVRTDYGDQAAWDAFHAKIEEAERDLLTPPEANGSGDDPQATTQKEDVEMDEDEDEGGSSDSDDEAPPKVFAVVEDTALSGLSNLALLRLFADVCIRRAPKAPQGAQRIKPGHRLIDRDGWQEIYTGKNLWVYDATSNRDGCARVVSMSGDMYGTATGDSWRARASFLPELQVNMASGMTIDFGGLDRWDFAERGRNLEEAEQQFV